MDPLPPLHVALTGGPCGGKTSFLAASMEHLSARGYRVILVPEAATLLMTSGIHPRDFPGGHMAKFQELVFRKTLSMENEAIEAADMLGKINGGRRSIILCDRGLPDGSVYCSQGEFNAILRKHNMTMVDARDARYNYVIHLATAPREFYGSTTNRFRDTSYEDACRADRQVRDVWTGHPHFKLIGNKEDFKNKISRALTTICRALGEPAAYGGERKYLLFEIPDIDRLVAEHGGRVHHSVVVQTYLKDVWGNTPRVREQSDTEGSLYFYTVQGQSTTLRNRPDQERLISKAEYEALLDDRDPRVHQIRKTRQCFVLDDQYYKMEMYGGPVFGVAILSVEASRPEAGVSIPPCFSVEREVTYEKDFSDDVLAHHEGGFDSISYISHQGNIKKLLLVDEIQDNNRFPHLRRGDVGHPRRESYL